MSGGCIDAVGGWSDASILLLHGGTVGVLLSKCVVCHGCINFIGASTILSTLFRRLLIQNPETRSILRGT